LLNTCITSLAVSREFDTDGASLLFPGVAHLTALTILNLAKSEPDRRTGFDSTSVSYLCSALAHLTALTDLNLSNNDGLTADDGARVCGAVAAAGMTRLKKLGFLRISYIDFKTSHICPVSSIVGCESWRQLNLPQPPDIFVELADRSEQGHLDLVQYLMSSGDGSCTLGLG
jgi:hypothetical protein